MDLYELLGIARGATLIEIKRSYKRLARKYHPDINPGDHDSGSSLQGDHASVRDVERSRAAAAIRRRVALGRVGIGVVRVRGIRLLGRRASRRRDDVRGSVRGGVLAEAGRATGRAGARRRPSCIGVADLRRGDAWHAAADDADSPRHVPVVPRGRPAENRGVAMPALPGQRSPPLAPRQHGVFEKL